jgi:hypothetical protein
LKELEALKARVAVPSDFLTTVTVNAFRPQYYFDKDQVVFAAAKIHEKYATDIEQYAEYALKTLPIMLDAHKILCAVNIFDKMRDNELVLDILEKTRPDHVPDFWLTITKYHKELGLKRSGLGSRGRKSVWKFLKRVAERRGLKTVALWFLKNRVPWSQVCYQSHVKFRGDLEVLAARLLFGRKVNLGELTDEATLDFLTEFVRISREVKEKTLTLEGVKESNLPFLTIEGLVSSVIDTTSLNFYDVAFDKMTYYEALRRTGALLRCGFLDRYHDIWLQKMQRGARVIDPADIASVAVQHPELSEDLRDPLATSLEQVDLNFPDKSVVICDASRSMKLKKTFPRPRVLWELIALIAAEKGVPCYLMRDKAEPVPRVEGGVRGIARAFGTNDAYNPTSISRAFEVARERKPKWVFLVSDCQTNIPYRGHEKLVAERMGATIVTLNPTVNPLEPEAATRLGAKNEVFLPLRDLRFLKNAMGVLM